MKNWRELGFKCIKETTKKFNNARRYEHCKCCIWDELLNEIYGDLDEILSEDEMDGLRTEQRDWIEARDSQAL